MLWKSARSAFVSLAAAVLLAGGATAALAQSMSLPEQQIEAKRLTALCNNDRAYQGYLGQAKAGSMRATYEASAALIQCFYNNVDARYPAEQKQKWLEAIQSNKQKAAALSQ
jgi:hypothetical protein